MPARAQPLTHSAEPPPISAVAALEDRLNDFYERQFTGRLDITVGQQRWSLYLGLGRLAWATGGPHPTRRWRRQLIRSNLFVSANKVRLRQGDRFECWDYQVLTLLAQRKIASAEQAIATIRGVITEVLFEIIQAIELTANRESASADFELVPHLGTRPSSTDTGILPRTWTVEIEQAIKLTASAWQQWTNAGLTRCSLNLAPALRQPEQLRQQTSAKVYQNLTELVNGKRSLRDISVLVKRDLLGLTRSLLPYIRQQTIGLVEIPDLPLPAFARQPVATDLHRDPTSAAPATPTTASPAATVKGRIVCVDDNPQICYAMKQLLASASYEMTAVQEAIQALPTLLQYKPDLIFLDLVMPIASGYEICTQIRRVSAFKEIPVIILTGNDGIVDRVRAKMVGATDFLAKPIDAEKVLATVERYLSTKTADL